MRQHKMLPQCKNRVQPPPPRNAKEIGLKPGLGVPKPDAPDKMPIYSKAAILLSAGFFRKILPVTMARKATHRAG